LSERNAKIELLQPLLGQKPWRARLGVGSFLTFDFGRKVKKENHWYGEWHLWIQQCEWSLGNGKREIVNSDSPRNLIELAVRNLEKHVLTKVDFSPTQSRTEFTFSGNIHLRCGPYAAGSGMDTLRHSELWMLFMPNSQVLSAVPVRGLSVEPASAAEKASV